MRLRTTRGTSRPRLEDYKSQHAPNPVRGGTQCMPGHVVQFDSTIRVQERPERPLTSEGLEKVGTGPGSS